jgi:pimeloyl-ACP methyl ester carboxylesterase
MTDRTLANSQGTAPERSQRTKMIRDVLIIFVAYVLLSPQIAMPFLYNKMIFFPDRNNYEGGSNQLSSTLQSMSCQRRDVSFPSSNGARLHGLFMTLPSANHVMLISHGNGGNITTRLVLAEALLKCGNSVFLYDYQGYGQSEGQPTVPGICDDATSAYDYLVNTEKVDPHKIIAYGESIGTPVTCALSERRQLSGIILQSGFPSLVYAANDRLWFTCLYPASWFPKLDCLSTVEKVHAPLLLLHGADDPIFPPDYSRLIYKKAVQSKELTIIEHMGHSLADENDPLFQNAIVSFTNTLRTAH